MNANAPDLSELMTWEQWALTQECPDYEPGETGQWR